MPICIQLIGQVDVTRNVIQRKLYTQTIIIDGIGSRLWFMLENRLFQGYMARFEFFVT